MGTKESYRDEDRFGLVWYGMVWFGVVLVWFWSSVRLSFTQ